MAAEGYRVTGVDPYDGSGHGPTRRDAFDALSSISVLERLDERGLGEFVDASRRFLTPGGRHVHAIDFVAAGAGAGAERHRRMLGIPLGHFGIGEGEIEEVIALAMTDTETCFPSAEAHRRWRGSIPYERFPMRKVLSIRVVR